jgi:hypothetical protein
MPKKHAKRVPAAGIAEPELPAAPEQLELAPETPPLQPEAPQEGLIQPGIPENPDIEGALDIPEPTRSDEVGVPGIDVDLEKDIDGRRLYDILSLDLAAWLNAEIDAQAGRISKLAKWEDQYNGKKPDKDYPYMGCHNTSIPVSMFHTDAVAVRIMDAIFSQKKTFIIQGKEAPFFSLAPELEDGLDWWARYSGLKKALFSPLLQGIKTGTGLVKVEWVDEKKTVYRYASSTERAAGVSGLVDMPNGEKVRKHVLTTYSGPRVLPISREDWVISSDATSIQDAFLCGFKTQLRLPEIRLKVKQGFYRQDSLDGLTGGDEIDETKRARVQAMDKDIAETGIKKYDIWELWVRYDVDDDGEEDDIVVSYHLPSRTILRAIYNPYFAGFRPFKDLVFMPAAYQFDGKGTCEILEKLQEEIDSIHNQRLDRMDQINAQMYVVSSQAGIDFKVLPGMVYTVDIDPTQAVVPLQFPDVYPSTFNEEQLLNSYIEKTVGISPQLLGQQTAERPVAQDTISLIQEANKKFKFGIDNIRDDIADIGMMVLEMFAQYQPKYQYFIQESGKYDKKTVDFPASFMRDGIKVQLSASSELLNTEARRQIGLTLFQLLGTYMDRMGSSAMTMLNPQVPPEFKRVLADGNRIGVTLMKQIVRDFGIFDEDEIVLDLNKALDIDGLIQQQQMAIMQQQMQKQMAQAQAQVGSAPGQPQPPQAAPMPPQAGGNGGGFPQQ